MRHSRCENGAIARPAPTVTSFSTQYAPTLTPSPSRTSPSNTQPTSIVHVAPAAKLAAHVDARRIGDRRPGEHQRVARLRCWTIRSSAASCARSLTPSTDDLVGRDVRGDRHAFGDGHRDDVGQVVLALRVVRRQRSTQRASSARRRRHERRC